LWRVDTQEKFNAPKGFFGRACSPMIEDDSLMLDIGGRNGAGIVAFDRKSGSTLWQATHSEASYSSPTTATIHGRRYSFFFDREGLVSLNPTNGHVYFEFPWRPDVHASVNAATPLIIQDLIFLSTSYGRGATVLRFHESGPRTLWAKDNVLSNHYATSVYHQGFLYGFHGRQEEGCLLRCVELQTGNIMWSQNGLKSGTVLLAGDHLWILTESGELISATATSKQFEATGRAQILGFSTRAYPAIASGHLYGRDKNQMVCVQLAN
jgi:outer membrane protein assembly factor BamB